MNVRITPRGHPSQTHLYGGVSRIVSNGKVLELHSRQGTTRLPLRAVAEIHLDDLPGDYW